MFEMLVVFNNRDLPSTSWGKAKGNRLYVLAISQATVTNNSKALLCLVLGFLLDELLLLEKALLVQMGKLYSNYLCIFISGLTSTIGSFSWTINCVILDFFSDILIVLLPFFLCIYLSLPLRVPPPFSFSPSDHSCPAVVPHSIVPPLPYPGRSAVYFSGHSNYSRLCTHILSLELAASDEREY